MNNVYSLDDHRPKANQAGCNDAPCVGNAGAEVRPTVTPGPAARSTTEEVVSRMLSDYESFSIDRFDRQMMQLTCALAEIHALMLEDAAFYNRVGELLESSGIAEGTTDHLVNYERHEGEHGTVNYLIYLQSGHEHGGLDETSMLEKMHALADFALHEAIAGNAA